MLRTSPSDSLAASSRLIRITRPISGSIRAVLPGFTLLELAIVMFVMGLVMLIAMPYFGGFKNTQLKSEARRLAGRSNYLYEEAGAQKVMLRLNFDLDGNCYFVTRLDPLAAHPAFLPETGPAGGRILLPAGVRLRDVWVEGVGSLRRGTIGTQFYPGGAVDATVIHLEASNGARMTLSIDPSNGRVAIANGYLAPENVVAAQ